MLSQILNSEQDTKIIGKEISQLFKGGDILCLEGKLGAGKTTLVKGIAEALGIKGNITSPTFAIMNIYERSQAVLKQKNAIRSDIKKMVHIDTYRLKDENELLDIGVEDYLGHPDALCIIEWPEKIKKILKNKPIKTIKIEHEKDGKRKLTIK